MRGSRYEILRLIIQGKQQEIDKFIDEELVDSKISENGLTIYWSNNIQDPYSLDNWQPP